MRRFILLATVAVLAFSAPTFAGDKDVLAHVGDKDITRADLNAFLDKLPAGVKGLPPAVLEPMALDQLINDQLISKAALDAKVQDSKEYKDHLEALKTKLLTQTYFEEKLQPKLTDSAIRAEYEDLKKQNPSQKEYEARHMLVDTKEQAQDLIKQLDKGAKFAKLASENNKGPEKEKGGELGYVTPKEVVPEFGEALAKLKKGEYTKEPVKSQFGWHVILLEDSRMRAAPKFDDVKDQVKQHLEQKLAQDEIATLRKDAKVEIMSDKLAKMPKQDAAPAKATDDKKSDGTLN